MKETNPLLVPVEDSNGFPRFDQILPSHVEPALDQILATNRQQIGQLVEQIDEPTWENFMAPMEALDDYLEKMWSPVSHLNSVADNDDLRTAYEACLPKLSEYSSEMGQNQALFARIKQLREDDSFDQLDGAKRKVIENDLLSFRLSGVDLSDDKQKRYREISARQSDLANRFSQNLLDATDAWHLDVADKTRLKGLPENVLALAHSAAEESGVAGWRFSLQAPSYVPFLTYCEDRDLRQQMYYAYSTRASETGPNGGEFDNGPLIDEILALRQEKALLLGFKHYAAYSLVTKMADSAEEVEEFLSNLADKSLDAAKSEWKDLQTFAEQHCDLTDLKAWDVAWVSEKMQQHLFDFSQEALRPYFPLPKVLQGMFETVQRLFGIQVVPISSDAAECPPLWHEDVQFFQINNLDGETKGHFYIDLFARANKRGGAWMADCINRRATTTGMQLPVAFLTCNFAPPVGEKPSELSHDEVMTLFHEFGHSLHHMLTRINVSGVSGINGVPWDAVELPSQFLENWCWEREALDLISGHTETGARLPDELLDKMRAARNFQSAMQMLRQVEFSLFDLRLHSVFKPNSDDSVQVLLDRVRDQVAVVMPPDFNRFQNSFGHIFAGGYAAGYYSYKWAEVLSADAYSLFEERGVFDADTGQSFLENILEPGGAEEPMILFTAFRGRKPEIDALLRHSGLTTTEQAA